MARRHQFNPVTTSPIPTVSPIPTTPIAPPIIRTVEKVERPIKKSEYQVKYKKVVYLGVSERAIRRGAVTGTEYVFTKDNYRMPIATDIDERDYPSIIVEKGKGCARRSPDILFMLENEWNLELEQARVANS